MFSYPKAAMERAMKIQEVILRAMAKRITWWQAAEIIVIAELLATLAPAPHVPIADAPNIQEVCMVHCTCGKVALL